MKFNKFCILFALALVAPCAMSQPKVVQSSARKAPAWYGGAEKGFIIATVQAASLEQAQQMAMDNVRRQILEAVAQNVTSQTSNQTNQTTSGSMIDFVETFAASSATQAANLPFLKGLSASKVSDFYWEKIADKKTGASHYNYSVKYPFSTTEHQAFVRQFEEYDAQMYNKLKELEKGLDAITEVEQIASSMAAIDPLIAYFFDSSRKAEAVALKNRYGKLYSRLSIKVLDNSLGRATYALVMGGQFVKTSARPILKSQCASQIQFSANADNSVDLTYDYSGCVAGEENFIEVAYRFGSSYISQKIYFDIQSSKVQIVSTGDITLTYGKQTDATIANVRVIFSFESKYDSKFIVEGLSLYVPNMAEPLVFKNLAIAIDGPGLHKIDIESKDEYRLAHSYFDQRQPELSVVNGVMEIKNTTTGICSAVKIMFPLTH